MAENTLVGPLAKAFPEAKAGVTLNQFLQGVDKSQLASVLLANSKKSVVIDCAPLANSDSFAKALFFENKSQITAIQAVRNGAATGTAVTCTIDNDGSNPVDGTNIDLDALTTAGVPENVLLNSDNTVVPAEGSVKFTFAADGSSALAGGAQVIVIFENVD